jgi:hypothetical protein
MAVVSNILDIAVRPAFALYLQIAVFCLFYRNVTFIVGEDLKPRSPRRCSAHEMAVNAGPLVTDG